MGPKKYPPKKQNKIKQNSIKKYIKITLKKPPKNVKIFNAP